jgi:hypothetical protein
VTGLEINQWPNAPATSRKAEPEPMAERGVRVLYIAGTGRSGSTILARILGAVDGFFLGGELYYVWQRGLIENRLCGCGVRFSECDFWQTVLERAFGGPGGVDARDMARRLRHDIRVRRLPRMLLARGGRSQTGFDLVRYGPAVASLYRTIQSATGARVIVDSSKFPGYGFLLGRIPGLDVRVVHLVRDPRGAAYSWIRRKVQPDRQSFGYMQQRTGPVTAFMWNVNNLVAESLWRGDPGRYLRIRYEDFIRQPRGTVERVLGMLGEESAALPFRGERRVELGANHTFSGNPDRLSAGVIDVRGDEEWLSRMAWRDKAMITALTWPLLRRYGYATRPWRGPAGV